MRRLLVLLVAVAVAVTVPAAATSAAAPGAPSAQVAAKKKKAKKKKRAACPKPKPTTRKKARKSAVPGTATRKQATRKKATTKKRVCKKKRKPKPVKPQAPAPPSLAPIDYTANPGLSGERFAASDIERVVTELPMADGKTIHIETVKPKGATGLGVILESSPYHGTLYDRTGTRILPLPLGRDRKPVGLTGYFPRRGYAVVMMDLRGTGKSGGCLDHLGPKDQSDLKAVVEWAASQPWSSGRVGMVGHSYVGSTPVFAAAQNPKGLVTIVPSAGLSGMYEHQFQGGVPYNAQFLGPYLGYSSLALDSDLPPGLTDPYTGVPTGDGFGVDFASTGCGFTNLAANAGPSQLFGVEEPYHRERDAGPGATNWGGHVFLVHGINDEAARITSMAWHTARGGRPGDKTWIGQWNHGIGCCPNQRGIQWTTALHAWFDRHLLQRPVNTGPPVEVFLNDATTTQSAITRRSKILTFASWPPKPSATLTLGAGGDGSLNVGGTGPDGSRSYTADPAGYQGNETGHVAFRSAPVAADTTIVGVPSMDLVASQTLQGTNLIVNLVSESPKGERRRITHFAINAVLRDGVDRIAPVVPGEAMKLAPAPWTMGHVIRAGHRLVLEVASSDPEHLPFGAIDPQVSVSGGAQGTQVRLPVIEGATVYDDTFTLGQRPSGAGVTG